MMGGGCSDCRVITVLRVLEETAIFIRYMLNLSSHPCSSALYHYPISSVVFSHFSKKKTSVFMRVGAGFWKLWPRVAGGRMNRGLRGFSRIGGLLVIGRSDYRGITVLTVLGDQ
jgi:hypothetical protein